MILVLCVNMIYDVSQGRDFYEFFKIGIQNELLSGRLVNILNRGSEVAILAIGMTLVVSASAGTDISVGSVMALSAGVCCTLLAGAAAPSQPSLAVPVHVPWDVAGPSLGWSVWRSCGAAFNGALVAYLNIQPMVATLILWTAARAIGLLVCNNLIVYVRNDAFAMFGGYIGPVPTPLIIAAAVHRRGHHRAEKERPGPVHPVRGHQ